MTVLTEPRVQPVFADRIGLIDTENAFKLGPYIRRVEEGGLRVVRCNLGEPDFQVPLHIREEIKRQIDADNTHYCDPQGILGLREAIAEQLTETRGVDVTPDRVVVFPGGKPPIGFAEEAYVNPGEEIIYPSPGYPIYESFTRYVGAVPVPLHLSEERGFSFSGADLERLISPRTRLIIINFPSNPTGGVATRAQLEEIAEVILAKAPDGVRVYSDEVYEHILFDGATHASIASLPGMAERTMIVSGVSKSYSWTGGRVGWAAFPTVAEAQVFKNLNINYFSCISAYNQEGARIALEAPDSAAGIADMVASFETRRDMVVAGLNAIDGIHCHNPRGAFYVFPNIAGMCEKLGAIERYDRLPAAQKARTSPATMVQMFLLFRHGVATMDRRSFGRVGAEGQHFLRISYATGTDDLREALRRVAAAADDSRGFADFVEEGPLS